MHWSSSIPVTVVSTIEKEVETKTLLPRKNDGMPAREVAMIEELYFCWSQAIVVALLLLLGESSTRR